MTKHTQDLQELLSDKLEHTGRYVFLAIVVNIDFNERKESVAYVTQNDKNGN